MTNLPTTAAAIREELSSLTLSLNSAREDRDYLQRLQDAEAKIASYTERASALTDALAVAVEAEQKAVRDAMFAGLDDLQIKETVDPHSPGVLQSIFDISFTRNAWRSDLNTTVREQVTRRSFGALDPRIFTWIVERHPEKIPASIMELAPNDPHGAFERFFVAMRRGYLSSR